MYLEKKALPKIILNFFLITQVFSFALSLMDVIYSSGTWQQSLVDNIYLVRNLCFFLSILVILIYRRITIDDVLLIIFALFSYCIMRLIFPENLIYFKEIQPQIKYVIMAFVVVRASFFDFEEIKNYLVLTSRFVAVIVVASVMLNQQYLIMHSIYMEFANAMSIPLGLMIYSGIMNNKICDIVISGIGLFAILAFGSRGSLFTLFLLIILLLWIKYRSTKMALVSLFISVVIVIFGPSILSVLLEYLVNSGIDSRSISKLLSGGFLVSNDRVRIWEYLVGILMKNSIFGVGICGDRYYLPKQFTGVDATYAHNIILEILLDYGFLIGMLLISIIIYILIKCFFQETDKDRKAFFSVFVIVGVLQLMISRSWLTEQNFFILLALLLTYSTTPHLELVIGRLQNSSSR